MLRVKADEVAQSGHAVEDIGQSPFRVARISGSAKEDVSCEFCFQSDSTIGTFPNFCANESSVPRYQERGAVSKQKTGDYCPSV